MSKIICDICGTSYSDSATQCPICGCVRPAEAAVVNDSSDNSGGYTYVKGGRFSKSNVRKRTQSAAAASAAGKAGESEKPAMDKKRLSLIIVLVCLLLIVIAMFVYIGITMHNQNAAGADPDSNQSSASTTVPCTALKVSPLEFTMTKLNEGLKLEVERTPSDTTDQLKFESSDEKIVTVDQSGNVVCIGSGKAVITVSCGDVKKECRVTCSVEASVAPQPEETEPEVTVTVKLMRYNINDADFAGKQFSLYASGDVPANELTWVSDDPAVATVDNNGIAYAVAPGETDIHAKYNGVVVATCHIKCDFKDLEVDNSQEGGDTAEEYSFGAILGNYSTALTQVPNGDYSATLGVGEKFQFGLISKTDKTDVICLKWERVNPDDSDKSVSVSEDMLWITRTEAGSSDYCYFKATYDGTVYYLRIHG